MIKPLEQLRLHFRSRAQVIDLAKTLFLVSILTVLIWVYAERAQTTTLTLQVGLDVRASNATQFATLVEPANTPISIEIEGPRSKIDQLRNQLGRITVILPATAQPDTESTYPTVPLLNDYNAIRTLGVTVTSATPSSIKVRIDPRQTITVPLVLPDDLPVAVNNIVIDPPSVSVTAPVPVLRELFPTPRSGIAVDLSGQLDKITTTGPVKLDGVPILVPREPGLQVTPQRTNFVKFEVSAREADHVLRTVPIAVQQPLPTVGKWEVVTREKTLTNIQVRGPASEVAKLQSIDGKPPEITPVAVLKLSTDDRTATDVDRDVTIDGLPPGVTPVGQPPRVNFSVREIGTPE